MTIKFEPALSAAQQIFHALGLDQDAMLRHYNTPAIYPSRNRPERDPGSFSPTLARTLPPAPFCIRPASPNFSNLPENERVSFTSPNLNRHLPVGQRAVCIALNQDWSKAQTVGGSKGNQYTKLESGRSTGFQTPKNQTQTTADRQALSGASEKTQRLAVLQWSASATFRIERNQHANEQRSDAEPLQTGNVAGLQTGDITGLATVDARRAISDARTPRKSKPVTSPACKQWMRDAPSQVPEIKPNVALLTQTPPRCRYNSF